MAALPAYAAYESTPVYNATVVFILKYEIIYIV